jgi:hypothetical protein
MAKKSESGPMSIDITAPEHVEIRIRGDGMVVWINVDGVNRFRACKIKGLEVQDERTQNVKNFIDRFAVGVVAFLTRIPQTTWPKFVRVAFEVARKEFPEGAAEFLTSKKQKETKTV